MPPHAIIAALQGVLPLAAVLTEPAQLAPYECDGLSALRERPLAVVLPRTVSEVRAALVACHHLGVPVVARGAGTGLSGGATPHAQGIVLSLARLNRVLSIDPLTQTACVEPGVRNLAVSEAAAAFGLYYAPDPSSQIACTIGGNVAENSGGVHCLKYGLTVHNVRRVTGLLSDGTAVTLGSGGLDSPGLDLLAVGIGSEGLLLVVTEVLLQLKPRPPVAQVAMASFDDLGRACQAVADIIAAGIIPAGLEMMDRQATRAVEPFVNAGYDLEAMALLLVEADGTPEEVTEEMARIDAVLRAAGATAVTVSQSEAERLRLWSGRKNAFPAAGRISPDYYCMDGTLPRKQLGAMLAAMTGMEARYGLRCMNVFHAGDGNLHPLILFDANMPGEWARAEAFGAEILSLCVRLGGTITGEHGVGLEKIGSMCEQFTPEERAAFFAVRNAFDPTARLNPGKALPTLARCAEFGRQHVHAGQLPHADLPRF